MPLCYEQQGGKKMKCFFLHKYKTFSLSCTSHLGSWRSDTHAHTDELPTFTSFMKKPPPPPQKNITANKSWWCKEFQTKDSPQVDLTLERCRNTWFFSFKSIKTSSRFPFVVRSSSIRLIGVAFLVSLFFFLTVLPGKNKNRTAAPTLNLKESADCGTGNVESCRDNTSKIWLRRGRGLGKANTAGCSAAIWSPARGGLWGESILWQGTPPRQEVSLHGDFICWLLKFRLAVTSLAIWIISSESPKEMIGSKEQKRDVAPGRNRPPGPWQNSNLRAAWGKESDGSSLLLTMNGYRADMAFIFSFRDQTHAKYRNKVTLAWSCHSLQRAWGVSVCLWLNTTCQQPSVCLWNSVFVLELQRKVWLV